MNWNRIYEPLSQKLHTNSDCISNGFLTGVQPFVFLCLWRTSALGPELSAAFPPDVVVCALPMIVRWKHRKQDGEQCGRDQYLRVCLWARWCLNMRPPHFSARSLPPTGRQFSGPLMYLNAASRGAASHQSINTGNAIHLWNITPSLTVRAHHCGHHPRSADREEDNTRQARYDHAPSHATTQPPLTTKIALNRLCVGIRPPLVKYELPFFFFTLEMSNNLQKADLDEIQ